ncbi:MAG TPA: four helix bundle protein [Bacteroidales bacterium]|nr:four helix bundle protein [Bacteroidales bacterium]HRZ76435.1 four helix bundle protein [Bacteroidales bacterium]
MNNKEFGKVLENRTKEFALMVFRQASTWPDSTEWWVIRKQITRSGTSVGANYREANRSRSNVEFLSKIRICEAEANETIYWIELAQEILNKESPHLMELLSEAKELLALFTTIGNSLRKT